jgi:hypothetical protein
METTSKKMKFSAALSVGVIFHAGFATQLGLDNAQQNKINAISGRKPL